MKKEISLACECLEKGGLILYPSDTLWGIGCDAENEKAVRKIFALKKRSASKAMIVLVHHKDFLGRYVKKIPEAAYEFTRHAAEPLTIVYPGAKKAAAPLISSDGSIALRIVRKGFCHSLLKHFGRGIVSTSANRSGREAPLHFAGIAPGVLTAVDYVIDLRYEKGMTHKASSIVKIDAGGRVEILRK